MNATNTNITTTYMRIASGGSLDMTGGSLTLTDDRSTIGGNDATYCIYGDMTLKDVKVTAAGSLTASTASGESGNIVLSGNTSFTGTELIARDSASLSVLDSATVDVDSLSATNLTVSKDASITVNSYANLLIANLTIVMDTLEAVDFADIFKSELELDPITGFDERTTISVMDAAGNVYENVTFAYNESGKITGIVIPEPSAFGLLAGACALAFVASRRRRK